MISNINPATFSDACNGRPIHSLNLELLTTVLIRRLSTETTAAERLHNIFEKSTSLQFSESHRRRDDYGLRNDCVTPRCLQIIGSHKRA